MRYAHSTFPWLLALTLCAVSACDDDWFRVPLCEYSPRHELCVNSALDGMGTDGIPAGDLSVVSDSGSPTDGSNVSFTLAYTSMLTAYKWAGVLSFQK